MRTLLRFTTPALAAILLSACASGATKPQASNITTSVRLWPQHAPVAVTLASDKSVSRFAGAAQASGVSGELQGDGPVTVFAPTNAALQRLANTSNVMNDRAQLAQLVGCHVLPADLSPGTLSGVIKQNGGSLPITTQGGCVLTATQVHNVVTLTDQNGVSSTLTHGHVRRGNAMIYKVDTVFTPRAHS
ncbi:fasciclin domain-containing protein [Asticcacaulis solisilvae]|uniref:fasciclin domain-containing protein n=1 Tax=Asticcacaulis solisilvae TaxID=1217274 RepID=UPI003FD6C4FB